MSRRQRRGKTAAGRSPVSRLVAAVAVAVTAMVLLGQCARVDGQAQPMMPPPGVPQPQHQQQPQQQQSQMHQPQQPQMHQQQPQHQQSPQHQQPPQDLLQPQDQQPPPTAPWYETLPAVAMDYKVIIDPGKEDCYFQFVNPGATFYASAQVLRGGDGMAGFAVRHPNGQVVHPYQWKASSDYQDQESTGGYYSVCIDNQFSKFAAKLVNLYITVIRYDKWDEYHKEIEDMNVSVENFTATVKAVESNINYMLQHQYHVRSQENRDYNLLVDNKTYVNRWSIMQIFLIMGTSTLQVYFVRKLFETKSGKSKTRA